MALGTVWGGRSGTEQNVLREGEREGTRALGEDEKMASAQTIANEVLTLASLNHSSVGIVFISIDGKLRAEIYPLDAEGEELDTRVWFQGDYVAEAVVDASTKKVKKVVAYNREREEEWKPELGVATFRASWADMDARNRTSERLRSSERRS